MGFHSEFLIKNMEVCWMKETFEFADEIKGHLTKIGEDFGFATDFSITPPKNGKVTLSIPSAPLISPALPAEISAPLETIKKLVLPTLRSLTKL